MTMTEQQGQTEGPPTPITSQEAMDESVAAAHRYIGELTSANAMPASEDQQPQQIRRPSRSVRARVALKAAHRSAMQAQEQLVQNARIDSLTGLASEDAWKEDLQTSLDTLEDGYRVVVTVTDVDGFKAVNDTLGHGDGDELLGIVGEAETMTYRRESDMAGHLSRLHGDEFAVKSVVKDDPKLWNGRQTHAEEEAKRQEEKLNDNFQMLIKDTKFNSFDLRLSSGSAINEPGDTAESLLMRADLSMFEKKYHHKAEKVSVEDRVRLRDEVIPFLEKQGARVEPWLRIAAELAP